MILCPDLILLASSVSARDRPCRQKLGLMEITETGRLLTEYDAAAWHSTDAVKALKPEEGKADATPRRRSRLLQ